MHDPGGKTFLPFVGEGGAEFSGPDNCYRDTLWRGAPEGRYILWIGCNPSVANADFNDPTIAREVALSTALGYSRYVKMNVSPYRCTNPYQIATATVPLQPPEHTLLLYRYAWAADRVILACGVLPACLDRSILADLAWLGVPLWCLGTCLDGSPRHPLYMPSSLPLARWYGWQEGLGPTDRFYAPDEGKPVKIYGWWSVGDCYASPRSRGGLRALHYWQCTGFQGEAPVFVPADHLATRYRAEVDAYVRRLVTDRVPG